MFFEYKIKIFQKNQKKGLGISNKKIKVDFDINLCGKDANRLGPADIIVD